MNSNLPFVTGRFDSQTAIVTGGGSGIGRAVALRFAREGAKVTIIDISGAALEETRSIFEASSLPLRTLQADISEEQGVADAVNSVAAEDGRIDVLVHSAGIAGPTGVKITEVSADDYDRVYRVNQRSAFLLLKSVLPHMIARNYGRVLIFASIAGKDGNPNMCAYTSTKAAIIGLVKGVGKEYAETGITVNAVAPAVIRTPLNELTSPEQLRYMIDKIPMKRLGTIDEVASLAGWACSHEASFTTGFVFDLSGGRAVY